MEKESSRLKKVAEEKINMYYTCDTDVNMTHVHFVHLQFMFFVHVHVHVLPQRYTNNHQQSLHAHVKKLTRVQMYVVYIVQCKQKSLPSLPLAMKQSFTPKQECIV